MPGATIIYMKLFPKNILVQLEFDKVKELIAAKANSQLGKERVIEMRLHTQREYIINELQQTADYKVLLNSGVFFPNDFIADIRRDLKLLSIPGATLVGEQFMLIKKLAQNTASIFRWFTVEMGQVYPALMQPLANTYYEKTIIELINIVLDEVAVVKDNASEELKSIRMRLYKKRNEQRRIFDRIASKLNKLGYLTDISESFMNGRRVLAVYAEQKRQVKGILHSESDSRRTSYIEPEETSPINNEVYALEHEEQLEVNRILKKLTADLSIHASLLQDYFVIAGTYDFIKAKALFAIDTDSHFPVVLNKSHIHLINAYHPLLKLYNQAAGKPTIPTNIELTDKESILVISGPNAGGKTVTMKTVGLLQIMLQSGLLVPVSPDSTMGIFKQIMIHIGDDQDLQFELSTYSSHLKNMKYFIEEANGRTLFFVDELGSGSDPNLGGAFAEVIMEELAFKKAFGIVTTHYLNLKVMAGKVKGIVNGAMLFDEKKLMPLYKLQVGKPGSSYTFSIAERIGLDQKLITKAKTLVDESQYKLDQLLNKTEQDLQQLHIDREQADKLVKENKSLRQKLEALINNETHKQETERLTLQNKVNEEKLIYLRDMERKLKAMVMEWKKAEDKNAVVKTIQALLYNDHSEKKKENITKKLKKSGFEDLPEMLVLGDMARLRNNRQVGTVIAINGKKATVQIGNLPMQVQLQDLIKVVLKAD